MKREDVKAIVERHVREVLIELGDIAIDPAQSLRELGASSLDMVEIVSASMRELRVKVPREKLNELRTIDGLIDLLSQIAGTTA